MNFSWGEGDWMVPTFRVHSSSTARLHQVSVFYTEIGVSFHTKLEECNNFKGPPYLPTLKSAP